MHIIIPRVTIKYIYKSNSKNSKNISIVQNKTAEEEQKNEKQRGKIENNF